MCCGGRSGGYGPPGWSYWKKEGPGKHVIWQSKFSRARLNRSIRSLRSIDQLDMFFFFFSAFQSKYPLSLGCYPKQDTSTVNLQAPEVTVLRCQEKSRGLVAIHSQPLSCITVLVLLFGYEGPHELALWLQTHNQFV